MTSNGLHHSPGLYLVCRGCGGHAHGDFYCARCREEIDALNQMARAKSVQTGQPAKLCVLPLPLPLKRQIRDHLAGLLILGLALFVNALC